MSTSAIFAAPFKSQFDRLLKQIGIPILYTRSDHRFPCTQCTSPDEDGGEADCANCFGTGYKAELQCWWAAYSDTIARLQAAHVPLAGEGYSFDSHGFFFTRSEERPTPMDRIFVVEWDRPRDRVMTYAARPLRIVQAYLVVYAEAHIAGAAIYHTSHCDFVSKSKPQYERVVLAAPIPRRLDFTVSDFPQKPSSPGVGWPSI